MVDQMLTCCKCKQEKPTSAFHARPTETHKVHDSDGSIRIVSYVCKRGFDYRCKACRRIYAKQKRVPRVKKPHVCTICGQTDLREFSARGSRRNGLQAYCKACRRLYAKLGSVANLRAIRG